MNFTTIPRWSARWLVGLAAIVLTVLLTPASPARAGGGGIPVPATSFDAGGKGAVSAADEELVIKVRLAGLWEIPAGNMAQRKSEDPRVRRIGRSIAAQHVVLDKLDREVARKLGIELPNQPNSDQQGWLAEMRNATPAAFDQIFIDRLRAAHGKIFPAIATIRASTRNDSIRQLAQQTNQFVMTHITLLESSGIVDYGALPTAPAPAAAVDAPVVDGRKLAAVGRFGIPGVSSGQLLLVLAVGLTLAVMATASILRKR